MMVKYAGQTVYHRGQCGLKNIKAEVMLGLGIMLLLCSVMTPVSAVQIEMTEEQFERAYAANPNNHTYVYVEPDPVSWTSKTTLHVDEDLQMRRYAFDGNGWTYYDAAYVAPDDVSFVWNAFNTMSGSIFSNTSILPTIIDSIGADGGPAGLNTTVERSSFQLRTGQVTSVVLDPNIWYYGVLGITSEEFIHLTISSRQDYTTGWQVAVIDPEGRAMGGISGDEGDTTVLPFRPSGPGTYVVVIMASASSQSLLIFDLLPQAVAPTQVAFGELVQGVLSGSELVVESDTGSIVHTEKAPTVHTYKFYSEDVALISYSFNYPELSLPIVPLTPVSMMFSSDAFVPYFDFGQRYSTTITSPTGDIVYYRSSNGETYYVSVMGADNVEYALYHEGNVAEDLPVNQEFTVTNDESYPVKTAYSLNLTHDSFMKLNSSASALDYSWAAWAVYDNGMCLTQQLQWATTIQTAQFYYLPAGYYLFQVAADAGVYDEFEFNIGQVYDEPTGVISRIGGFRVDSTTMTQYNGTLRLLNHDNITVRTHMTVFDRYIISAVNTNPILGNRWNGSSWLPVPISDNYTQFQTAASLTDDYSLVAVCPYRVSNNTPSATNDYVDYPVQYGIEFEDYSDYYYNGTASLVIATTAVAHNFTLSLPGEATEYYLVDLSVPKGTWFNVTIIAEDVDTFSATLLQDWGTRTHRTLWTDLNDELVGSLGTELSFQFGSISGSMKLVLNIGRDLADNGSLYVRITPFNTSLYTYPPALVAQAPDLFATLAGYALPIGIGIVVVVVVAVVYVKKFRK